MTATGTSSGTQKRCVVVDDDVDDDDLFLNYNMLNVVFCVNNSH